MNINSPRSKQVLYGAIALAVFVFLIINLGSRHLRNTSQGANALSALTSATNDPSTWKGINLPLKLHPVAGTGKKILQQSDFDAAAQAGANVIRLSVHADPEEKYGGFSTFVDDQGNVINASNSPGIADLKAAITMAAHDNLKVIIDMHTAPGTTTGKIFKQGQTQWTTLAEIWKEITQSFQGNSTVVAFDLMNEPNLIPGLANEPDPTTGAPLGAAGVTQIQNAMYNGKWSMPASWIGTNKDYTLQMTKVIKEIRAIDSNRTVIVEGFGIAGNPVNFNWMQPINGFNNIVYSFHMYQPTSLTSIGQQDFISKGLKGTPFVYPQDESKIESAIAPVAVFSQKYNVPIYVGEFGIEDDAIFKSDPTTNTPYNGSCWMSSVMQTMASKRWGWTFWDFWNTGRIPLSANDPRYLLLSADMKKGTNLDYCLNQPVLDSSVKPLPTFAPTSVSNSGSATFPTVVVPQNASVYQSDIYQVHLTQGSVAQDPFVYVARAGTDASAVTSHTSGRSFHYVVFSATGKVTATIIKHNSTATSAVVRPLSAGIATLTTKSVPGGKSVTFTYDPSQKVSIEFNDDSANTSPILLLSNPLEDSSLVPDLSSTNVYPVDQAKPDLNSIATNKNTVYFTAGIHEIGYWTVPANISHIYLAPGSIVQGYIFADRSATQEKLVINGRGILTEDTYPYHYPGTMPGYSSLQINGGNNDLVEGITIANPTNYTVRMNAMSNPKISNIKILGLKFNNDGIHFDTDSNPTLENSFIVDADDMVTYKKLTNLTINNNIFWQLSGGAIIQLGWGGTSLTGTNTISNNSVIHAEWGTDQSKVNAGFLVSIDIQKPNANDSSPVIENVMVDNLTIEEPIMRFMDIRTSTQRNLPASLLSRFAADGKDHAQSARTIVLKNVSFSTNQNTAPVIFLNGYSDQYSVSNIVFDHVAVNGTCIADARNGLFQIGKFVSGVTFNCSSTGHGSVNPQDSSSSTDTTLPILYFIGPSTMSIPVGSVFTDPGVTATDNIEGDITSRITSNGIVNTAVPGTYTVNYEVSDSSGNIARAARTIVVFSKDTGTQYVIDNTPTGVTETTDQSLEAPLSKVVTFHTESTTKYVAPVTLPSVIAKSKVIHVYTSTPLTIAKKPIDITTAAGEDLPNIVVPVIPVATVSNQPPSTVVTSIDYALDGKPLHSTTSFPDTWEFDTRAMPNGGYNLEATYHYLDGSTQISSTTVFPHNTKTIIQNIVDIFGGVWQGIKESF